MYNFNNLKAGYGYVDHLPSRSTQTHILIKQNIILNDTDVNDIIYDLSKVNLGWGWCG
jgi:hypothetical protein